MIIQITISNFKPDIGIILTRILALAIVASDISTPVIFAKIITKIFSD